MDTPICDFIKEYIKSGAIRMHMPGHKGKSLLGFEQYDITEISGADCLYKADGIIKKSEDNATRLFESGATFYSCEGSSLCVRAMLYLAKMYAKDSNGYVLAGRNAHSSFISACALLDLDVKWLYPKKSESYLSCTITADDLKKVLESVDKKPLCVYVTSPDYLGNMCDISALSQVCKQHGTILIVDNAHGAYLKFLDEDMHPISLGADMCCDSAHKTLPVLTGGAYLHISKDAPVFFKEHAKSAFALFGSTSPSYLILASLDNANKYIADGYKERLNQFISQLHNLFKIELLNEQCSLLYKNSVLSSQSSLCEPMKIVLKPKKIGYSGRDFAKILEINGIFCEFYDDDFVVLMPTIENGIDDLEKLNSLLSSIKINQPILEAKSNFIPPVRKMSIREATFANKERIKIKNALGRILSSANITCPPAVSLIVCGEEFNQSTIDLCQKHGFDDCYVVEK